MAYSLIIEATDILKEVFNSFPKDDKKRREKTATICGVSIFEVLDVAEKKSRNVYTLEMAIKVVSNVKGKNSI
jgi:hypothetical protein